MTIRRIHNNAYLVVGNRDVNIILELEEHKGSVCFSQVGGIISAIIVDICRRKEQVGWRNHNKTVVLVSRHTSYQSAAGVIRSCASV